MLRYSYSCVTLLYNILLLPISLSRSATVVPWGHNVFLRTKKWEQPVSPGRLNVGVNFKQIQTQFHPALLTVPSTFMDCLVCWYIYSKSTFVYKLAIITKQGANKCMFMDLSLSCFSPTMWLYKISLLTDSTFFLSSISKQWFWFNRSKM